MEISLTPLSRFRGSTSGGQGRVIELPAGEPGVELAEGVGVGAAGVGADGGVDQAARGRARRASTARAAAPRNSGAGVGLVWVMVQYLLERFL